LPLESHRRPITQRNAGIINDGTIEPFSEPRRPTLVRD
jgi:hypothetical protein